MSTGLRRCRCMGTVDAFEGFWCNAGCVFTRLSVFDSSHRSLFEDGGVSKCAISISQKNQVPGSSPSEHFSGILRQPGTCCHIVTRFVRRMSLSAFVYLLGFSLHLMRSGAGYKSGRSKRTEHIGLCGKHNWHRTCRRPLHTYIPFGSEGTDIAIAT